MSPANQATKLYARRIEEKRHEPALFLPTVAPPRGMLQATEDRGNAFCHQRLAASPELADFIHHFWYVQWDLRGSPPSTAETLPHPSCYLVFEHDLERPIADPSVHCGAEVSGVTTGRFSRTMNGRGRVFGLKFRPGGIRPFLKASVSTLTDRVVPAAEIFGPDILTLASHLRTLDSPESMAAVATAYFASRMPASDPSAALAATLVETILNDPTMLSVSVLSRRSGLGVRALQRLFHAYVGASPKWVIRRFRLHELLERFHSGEELDGAQLALDLGYADQAHLINDFRKLAGVTPRQYLRRGTWLSSSAAKRLTSAAETSQA
jgi:AraC-like DNA-binding protein